MGRGSRSAAIRRATPYQRLLTDPRTSVTIRARLSALQATLDPVRLLSEIRVAQKQLVEIADRPVTVEAALGR
jgi:ABC-type sugar transport system ATPase subunit